MTTSKQFRDSKKLLVVVIILTTLPLLIDTGTTTVAEKIDDEGLFCRDNYGQDIPAKSFALFQCYGCLTAINKGKQFLGLNSSLDRHNEDLLKILCSLFTDKTSSCVTRVIDCCKAAEDCCLVQNRTLSLYSSRSNDFCPPTWASINCVGMTPKNTIANVPCPTYVWPSVGDGVNGTKVCFPNATWETRVSSNITWEHTDYHPCLQSVYKKQEMVNIVRLVLCCISLVSILVSLCIFLGIRPLRKELRIQMHVNLFVALFMQLVLETLIYAADYQQFRMVMYAQGGSLYDKIPYCQFIGIGNRFFHSATYSWYVCEAVFLYRLLDRAFEQMRSLKYFYLGGWGTPLVINLIYCILRSLISPGTHSKSSGDRCWLNDFDHYEWLHRGPSFIGLILNTCFLIYILYTVYNLHNQGSSTNNYRSNSNDSSVSYRLYMSTERMRRSVRAALLLAPLFGLNTLLVAFQREDFTYQFINAIVAGSQGALVAVIFCFMNGEVKSAVKLLLMRSEISLPFLNRGSSQTGSFLYASGSRSNSNTNRGGYSTAATDESRQSDSFLTTTPDRQRTRLTVNSPSLRYGKSSV